MRAILRPMASFLKRLFQPPQSELPAEAHLARKLHTLLLLGIILSSSFFIFVFPFVRDPLGPFLAAGSALVFLTLFVLLQIGKVYVVAYGLILSANTSILLSLVFNGGLRDEAGLALIAVLSITSFVLGRNATIVLAIFNGLFLIGLYIGEHLFWIEEHEHIHPVGFDDLLISLIAVTASTAVLGKLVAQLETQYEMTKQQAEELEVKNQDLERTQQLLEEQAAHLSEAMQQLQEIHTSLTLAKEEAESANRHKSDFLLRISHDLRSPMTSILGLVDGLLLDPPMSQTEREEWLAYINRNGSYLLSLIDNLLDLARIEAGRLELIPEQFSLFSCIKDVEQTMLQHATKKGVELLVYLDADVPPIVTADELRLRQVLINLLDNGIKFTSQGCVNMRVTQTAVSPTGPYTIRFSIVDTGMGIPENHLNTIFTPFEQIESKRGNHGAGLGLAICVQLLRLMGGELYVESQEGEGSHFWFELTLT